MDDAAPSPAAPSQLSTAPGRGGRPRVISVITPVFNEELTVRRCHEEVKRVCSALGEGYDYEHIFSDNCSTDGTLDILRELAANDPRVKVLNYSRNFGAEKSGFTAMRHANGDAVIGIPADLQEPPAMIPRFIEYWEKGYEVVYGVYRNHYEGLLKRSSRRFYYWLVDKLSPEPLPQGYSGFGLIDRMVVDEVLEVDDYAPYARGLIATVGFRQIGIPYDRQRRQAGESKHGLLFLLGFGANGIITHSLMPIRLVTLGGIMFAALAVFLSFLYVIIKLLVWNFQAPGATTTIVLVLFFSGIQLLTLGILGEYIGAIHSQVRRKPFVIVRERINIGPPPGRRRA